MKMKILRITLCLLILANLAVIFLNSSKVASVSDSTSKNISRTIAPSLVQNYDHLGEEEKTNWVSKINIKLRESAHAAEFLPLGFLMVILLSTFSKIRRKGLLLCAVTVLFCFLYALSDEWHQTFVDGRGFEWLDIGLDMLGSVIGCFAALVILWIYRFLRKRRLKS